TDQLKGKDEKRTCFLWKSSPCRANASRNPLDPWRAKKEARGRNWGRTARLQEGGCAGLLLARRVNVGPRQWFRALQKKSLHGQADRAGLRRQLSHHVKRWEFRSVRRGPSVAKRRGRVRDAPTARRSRPRRMPATCRPNAEWARARKAMSVPKAESRNQNWSRQSATAC